MRFIAQPTSRALAAEAEGVRPEGDTFVTLLLLLDLVQFILHTCLSFTTWLYL